MGYHTDFTGEFTITPPLTPEQVAYINAFSRTRRFTRHADQVAQIPDPVREAVGLPVGQGGCFFVGELPRPRPSDKYDGWSHEYDHPSTKSYNQPPADQPGLWCQWITDDTGAILKWDEGEKFYDYTEWLEYLIENFFRPWGRSIDGKVYWYGEDSNDRGVIHAKGNQVQAIEDVIQRPEPEWSHE